MTTTKTTGRELGYLSSCIAGDYRYASRLIVALADDESCIIVQRQENGAIGGMDGPGGAHGFDVRFEQSLPLDCTAKQLVTVMQRAMDDTLRRYGKPSKSFKWQCGARGLTQKSAQQMLASLGALRPKQAPQGAVTIAVSAFVNTHGKKPRGTGSWIFAPCPTSDSHEWFMVNAAYSDACAAAKKWARSIGLCRVYVMP